MTRQITVNGYYLRIVAQKLVKDAPVCTPTLEVCVSVCLPGEELGKTISIKLFAAVLADSDLVFWALVKQLKAKSVYVSEYIHAYQDKY